MNEIHQQPKGIETKQLELADVINDLDSITATIHRQELEAWEQAISARGEDNMHIYSNDKFREMAMLRALNSDVEYKDNRNLSRQIERRKIELVAEIDRMRRELRIALIDYEAAQLGRRAA